MRGYSYGLTPMHVHVKLSELSGFKTEHMTLRMNHGGGYKGRNEEEGIRMVDKI